MSSPSSSAQAALRALATQLREMRSDAGLTGQGLATQLGWHRTKISRIEHAARPPSAQDVRAWCRACDAEDRADDLVEALRSYGDAYVEWRRLQRTGLRRLQDSYVPLYERTRLLRVYSSMVVPGLVQTPEYIAAVFDVVGRRRGTRNDVDQAVEARMARRRVLYEGDHRFGFVLEESVLRSGLGGRDVMAGQLQNLLEAMALPSVSLGIIPARADRPQWQLEQFTLYDHEQVEVELLSARVTITTPSEIRLYADAFEDLAATAAYGAAARELITAAIVELDQSDA
ncbi:MAG: helix-turn-helix domain-containing protein [Streptosporangiales bacterium]|nr:helix-turn-helix domain-containing protein [Streptosporangiales bacterium]